MRVLRENLRVEIENEMRVFLESLNFEIEMRVSQKSEDYLPSTAKPNVTIEAVLGLQCGKRGRNLRCLSYSSLENYEGILFKYSFT